MRTTHRGRSVPRLLPERAFVVDLGCGDGRHAERIAADGHQVLGVDYSFEALRVARQTQPDDVEYRFLNLNDRHGLQLFASSSSARGTSRTSSLATYCM